MRVLPRVVIPAVAAGLAALLGVSGCSQFDKALGQQQALVSFKSGTPMSVRLQVRAACDKLPNVSAAPISKSVPLSSAVDVIVYCPAKEMQLKEARTHVRWPGRPEIRPR